MDSILRGEPEFILDLCKTSQPYQIVLARIGRKHTLAATLDDVQHRIAAQPADAFMSHLSPGATMLVPSMAWRVSHHFKELEGEDKRFLNSDLRDFFVGTAMQTIQFRLDRSGADLASEASIEVKDSGYNLHLNRSFLVLMKKRGGKRGASKSCFSGFHFLS